MNIVVNDESDGMGKKFVIIIIVLILAISYREKKNHALPQ
jgi:hypothetical protein